MTTALLAPERTRLRKAGWTRRTWEPWRDWAVLAVLTQGTLTALAVLRPSLPWVLLAAVVLGSTWAVATLTVLHDAGHKRFGRRTWYGVFAVQTAVPAGLWVGHWGLKHRVHHRLTQVFPYDEPTRSSSLVRLHPEASRRAVHRYQHVYAWVLYGFAWTSELKSQVSYLHTGYLAGDTAPSAVRRAGSFALEKAICLLILAPCAVALGWALFAVLMLVSLTIASTGAVVVTAVGHINVGVAPEPGRPSPERWMGHIVRTTASFNTGSRTVGWLTGGLTHHLAHHLRPVAPRFELAALHREALPAIAARAGEQIVEFPTLTAAVRGHWLRLRELGRPGQQPVTPRSAAAVPVGVGEPVSTVG